MSDLADRLDHEHIATAARWVAARLVTDGVARVRLTPGDMTEYPILIATPGPEWDRQGTRPGRYCWVTLCAGFGAGYEWHGGDVHPGYAAEKWTNHGSSEGTRLCTATVVALFLSAVGRALTCARDGHVKGVLVEQIAAGVEAHQCERCEDELVWHDDDSVVPVGAAPRRGGYV